MRKHLLLSTALALFAGLGFVSSGVQATPVTVDLSTCGGSASCTSNGVNFTGWENNGTTWGPANLTYKADPENETGLGVACTSTQGPKCGENEIDTAPPQYIAVDLSGIHFTSLSLGVGSVDCNGDCATPEYAYIYAASCADVSTCPGTLIGNFKGANYPDNAYLFTFNPRDLGVNHFLFVSPSGPDGLTDGDNILLASLSYDVPEPAVLGMFGLGMLLIGLFAGLRRRMD